LIRWLIWWLLRRLVWLLRRLLIGWLIRRLVLWLKGLLAHNVTGPHDEIDYEPDKTSDKHDDQPQHTVFTSTFSIPVHPDGNEEEYYPNYDGNQTAAPCTHCAPYVTETVITIVVVFRRGRRCQWGCNQQANDRERYYIQRYCPQLSIQVFHTVTFSISVIFFISITSMLDHRRPLYDNIIFNVCLIRKCRPHVEKKLLPPETGLRENHVVNILTTTIITATYEDKSEQGFSPCPSPTLRYLRE